MSEDEFYRIKRLPPYVIAEVNAMRAAARAAGEDIIDLGMGNPDLPPPAHVIEKLCEVAMKPDAHGYSQSKGIPGLRRAQANYYGRRFNVDLDPETEVVVTMGSKEGLASLATAITGPGDVVLVPKGYHPCAACHGYDLYYLNVMAGPKRTWKFHNAAEHEWLVK